MTTFSQTFTSPHPRFILAQLPLWAFKMKGDNLKNFLFIYFHVIQGDCSSHRSADWSPFGCVCGTDRCLAYSRVLVHVFTASASWCIVFLWAIWKETRTHKPEVTWPILYWVPQTKWVGYLAEECTCSAARMWPAHAPWVQDYKILWNKQSQKHQTPVPYP